VVIGIDVGTSGVRAVAADGHGTVLTGATCPLPTASREQPGIHEQVPADWWRVLCSVTANVTSSLQRHGSVEIGGISLVSTSGSLVLVNGDSEPVRPAIMYNDCRGTTKTPDAKATPSSEVQSAH